MTTELVIATGNPKKLKEIRRILAGLRIRILDLNDFPEMPEAPEEGETFVENAVSKAEYYAEKLGRPVLAEDSGLEVAALDGKPGVYSARFAGPQKKDADNIAVVLELMKDVPLRRRQAAFTSVVCIAEPGGKTAVFKGKRRGLITLAPRGASGFGYDPIFLIPELKKTFAQLTAARKNALSHRRIALEKAAGHLSRRRDSVKALLL